MKHVFAASILLLAAAAWAALSPSRDAQSAIDGPPGAMGQAGAAGFTGPTGTTSNVLAKTCGPSQVISGFTLNAVQCATQDENLAATLRRVWVSPLDFAAIAPGRDWARSRVSMTRNDAAEAEEMVANLRLPSGAVIQQVRCWAKDALPGSDVGNAIQLSLSVEGQSVVPPISTSCGGAFTADDSTLHAVPVPSNGSPVCAEPVTYANDTGIGSFLAHSLHARTTSNVGAVELYGCDVAYSITKALP